MLEDLKEVLVGNEKELCNVRDYLKDVKDIMPLKHPAWVRVASLCLLCSPCLYFSTRGLAFLTEGLLISRRDVDVCGEVGGEVKLGGELTVRDGDMGPMEL